MFYKIVLGAMCVVGLTACQTTALNLSQDNQENGKTLLSNALKKAIYQPQTWVSEHQLYLKNTTKAELVNDLASCQDMHDKRFIAQMTADNLVKFADVADLSNEKQAIYQQIKQDYLDCYADYEKKLASKQDESKKDYLMDTSDSQHESDDDWQYQMNDIMKIMGFSQAQVSSINQFLLKSGKITTTGIYQPLAGEMSLMFDAGFENKNLKYHYRLPVVMNAKTQRLYVKPDVFMPTIALHLDNQMGLSWQDKWYKFSPQSDNHLPKDMQLKAWMYALKQSFDELHSSQFAIIDSKLLIPNISHASQKIAKNGMVIKWQQTAKEQDNLYQDVIENYIQQMDKYLESRQDEQQQKAWQQQKDKLQTQLENRLAIEPDENNRLTGQTIYFILENHDLKQIFTKNQATMLSQNYQFNSFITFDPDESLINSENQPKNLAQLRKTIVDSDTGNVVDTKAEIERLLKLDDSRRLFGTEPKWLKYLSKIAKVDKSEDNE